MSKKSRALYIDNLRLLMIIFVIMVHSSVTYSGVGSWFYVEHRSLSLLEQLIFTLFNSFTQAYFMGILFFIAGYFIPGAYDKKGCSKFIKDRLFRLGIPVLIFSLILNPFINYCILNIDWGGAKPSFINYYSNYIVSLRFIGETGPLWFALALLIFSIIYAVIRHIVNREPKKIHLMFPTHHPFYY